MRRLEIDLEFNADCDIARDPGSAIDSEEDVQ